MQLEKCHKCGVLLPTSGSGEDVLSWHYENVMVGAAGSVPSLMKAVCNKCSPLSLVAGARFMADEEPWGGGTVMKNA